MSIRLYNSATHALEEFVPQEDGSIRMYVCGPTVYDEPHLGNLRPAVVFDVLHRLLKVAYPESFVDYARNFTDIDDKIIARANEQNIDIDVLTKQTIQDYESAMKRLNVLPPTSTPRATQALETINHIIERLIDTGIAYVSEGHVLFSVERSEHITNLISENADLEAGARVEIASYKRDPRDFVLWKPSKAGEPSYSGPRGLPGRPGWHIECSAMIHDCFRRSSTPYMLDIHGGGNDLKFPHHQCEIMQSESLHHEPLARYWLHNGMLTVNGQKMSKSAGNFIRHSDTVGWSHGETLRYLLLTAHYRQPLDFTRERLTEAQSAMNRLYGALGAVWDAKMPTSEERQQAAGEGFLDLTDVRGEELHRFIRDEPVLDALENDLNTPEALAALHGLADRAYKAAGTVSAYDMKRSLIRSGDLLGILQLSPDQWFHGQLSPAVQQEIERLLAQRDEARQRRDWQLADQIRSELRDAHGVEIEDTPNGTKWRNSTTS